MKEIAKPLTALQDRFVMAYTAYGSDTWKNAFLSVIASKSKATTDNSLSVLACRMLRVPKIDHKIKAIETARLAQAQVNTGFTIETAQTEYEEARTLAKTTNQPAAMVSATTGKARLYGMDKDAGGKDRVTVINVINYAGSADVEPPKVIDNKELENV